MSHDFTKQSKMDYHPATNSMLPAKEPTPLTAAELRRLLDELPEPEPVIIHKPSGVGMSERQFLAFFFGRPRMLVPFVEPEKIGTAVPIRRR